MKYIYSIIVVSVLFIGCGYKDSPVYVDTKIEQKK